MMVAFGENIVWDVVVVVGVAAVVVVGWVLVSLGNRWHPPDPKPRRLSSLTTWEDVERERLAREDRRRNERRNERLRRRGA